MKKGLRQLYVPLLSTWDIQTRDLMKKGLRRYFWYLCCHFSLIQTRDLMKKGLRLHCQ